MNSVKVIGCERGVDCARSILVGRMSCMGSTHTGNTVRVEPKARVLNDQLSNTCSWTQNESQDVYEMAEEHKWMSWRIATLHERCGYFCANAHSMMWLVCLPDVLSRLKAILTSDLSGDTRLVEVIIYPFTRPQAQNRAVNIIKGVIIKDVEWNKKNTLTLAWKKKHSCPSLSFVSDSKLTLWVWKMMPFLWSCQNNSFSINSPTMLFYYSEVHSMVLNRKKNLAGALFTWKEPK